MVSHHSHVALAILLLKKPSKLSRIIQLRVISIFKKFPIGLKQNLREEDNLSTRDNQPVPNVSFVRRFYCRCLLLPLGKRKLFKLFMNPNLHLEVYNMQATD